MIALILALACGPKQSPLPTDFDPKAGPLVPAMAAPIYATGHGLPKALSGAAAAIALDHDSGPTLEAAQHAAHRAGYPYPVKQLSVGWMDAGAYPVDLGRSLAATLRQGDHLGLARVRTQDKDRWVALVAHPADVLAPIHRELRLGAEVPIQTRSPCTWTLVSPSGKLSRGTTPDKIPLGEAGEWWLEVRTLNARVASVPLYVDMATPPAPLMDLPGEKVTGPGDGVALALELLEDVRKSFGTVQLKRDGNLDTLAGLPLTQVLDKKWTNDGGMARLRAAGFVGGPAFQVHCKAPSIATCIDQMLRTPAMRSGLLHPGLRLVGGAAQVRTDGVTLLLNLASE